MGKNADKRMAAFLASKNYKGATWMTEEIEYTRWVEEGRPMYMEPIVITGFTQKSKASKDNILT